MNRMLLIAIIATVLLPVHRLVDSLQAQPADPVRVTLGTYNVRNFFDVHDDPYTEDETAYVKSNKSIRALGKVIKEMNADFIGLQEMENEGILRRFIGWHLEDQGYRYNWVNRMEGTRGINTGFLSKTFVSAITMHRFDELSLPDDDRTWRFARGVIKAVLQPVKGVNIHVYVLHLKSKWSTDNDPQSKMWRLAEATRVAELIDELYQQDPDALVAVIGDLNDTPDSPPIQRILKRNDGSDRLLDVHDGISPDDRVTYLRAPYRATVDYILASPSLHKCLVDQSAKVLSPKVVEEASDHAPLVATFEFPAQ